MDRSKPAGPDLDALEYQRRELVRPAVDTLRRVRELPEVDDARGGRVLQLGHDRRQEAAAGYRDQLQDRRVEAQVKLEAAQVIGAFQHDIHGDRVADLLDLRRRLDGYCGRPQRRDGCLAARRSIALGEAAHRGQDDTGQAQRAAAGLDALEVNGCQFVRPTADTGRCGRELPEVHSPCGGDVLQLRHRRRQDAAAFNRQNLQDGGIVDQRELEAGQVHGAFQHDVHVHTTADRLRLRGRT